MKGSAKRSGVTIRATVARERNTRSAAAASRLIDRTAHWPLAGQARAFEREAVDGTKDSGGNLLRAEEFLGQSLHFFAGNRFDGSENFVERIETAEIKFLAGQVGHARAGRFERKHQRTFEM